MAPHKEVKKILIDQGLTQVKLAKMTGYSLSHLNCVVNGHYEAPETRKAIAAALNKDVHELFGNQTRKPE